MVPSECQGGATPGAEAGRQRDPLRAGRTHRQARGATRRGWWRAPLHDFPLRDEILYQFSSWRGHLPGGEILEIGPGSGHTAYRLAGAGACLTLVECTAAATETLVRAFSDMPNVHPVHADACAPGLTEKLGRQFDFAYALDMFEYAPDPAACLRNLAGTLRPGGELLLTFPNWPPPRGDGVTWFHQRGELEALLRGGGFAAWEIFAVRPRRGAWRTYEWLHERPLRCLRRLRAAVAMGPRTYEGTWAFQHGRFWRWFRVPLHGYWALLGLALRAGGPVFVREELGPGLLRGQLAIRAWK